MHFWSKVFSLITSVALIACKPPDPKLALLGVVIEQWPIQFQTLLTCTFIAARLSIAISWKDAKPPLPATVIYLKNNNAMQEFLLAKAQFKENIFWKQWSPCLQDVDIYFLPNPVLGFP